MRDLHSVIRVVPLINPGVYSADETGDSIDTKGFGSVEIVFIVGAGGDVWSSTDKIGLEIEESSDDAAADAFAAVAAANLLGDALPELTDSDDHDLQAYRFGVRPAPATERYIRPKLNFSGTHATGTPFAVFAILGEPFTAPTDNP